MTALSRQEAKIFAINALASQVTAFRTTESASPSTTKVPNAIQNEKYLQGWLNPDNTGNVLPFAEDMNGVFLTLSYNTAYLYEKGIPEYSASQTYYLNSFCQYEGKLYRCKVDGTINYVPTNTSKWDEVPTTSYSITNIGTGAKIYNESVTGPNFQLKTLVAGSNVTLTESDDSITIEASGGSGTTITATSPLSLSNNVLSIAAATGSQSGYLSAADWTSFNSKLSSTIFSSNNTWTGINTFSEVDTAYLVSDSAEIFVFEDSRFENSRFKVGYNGVNLGIFPEMSSTDGYNSYLGDSTYRWDFLYALNGSFSGSVGINTISSLGTLVSPYNIGDNKSVIALSYNPPVLGGTVTQWGWLGYLSSTEIGIFPETTDTCSLGSSSHYWKNAFIGNISTEKIDLSAAVSIGIAANARTLTLQAATANSATKYVYFDGDGFYPTTNDVELGGASYYWSNVYGNSFNLTAHNAITMYNTAVDPGIALGWKTTGSTGTAVTVMGYHTYFMPSQSNLIDLGGANNRWKTVYYGTLNPSSDARLKENIEPLEAGLEVVKDLEIKSYTFIDNPDHIEYGILAQDVAQKYPELVSIPDSKDGCYGIYLHNFMFTALKAIQELSAKVDDLQQQLMELKK